MHAADSSSTPGPTGAGAAVATSPASDVILGIDLGTTNSLVAFCDEAGPRVLFDPDDPSRGVVPSAVRFQPHDEPPSAPAQVGRHRVIVGQDAFDRAPEFPEFTVLSVKRLMGRSLADAAPDVPYLSYRVVEGEHGQCRVRIGTRDITPQEVSAHVLAHLRSVAERALAGTSSGRPLRLAVVTVPAYFDDAQRQATRDAGRLAGLEVVRIVNEPTAAALAYGLGLDRAAPRNQRTRTIAVYDLGGGTFDISILRLVPADEPGEREIFQVLATAGDTRLGGDDLDHALVALFLSELPAAKPSAPGPASPDSDAAARTLAALPPSVRRQVKRFAQTLKHRLSDEPAATVEIDTAAGVYRRTVTRDELETLARPLVDRSLAACARAMADARQREPSLTIDAVVMVGGSTRMPLVRRRVGEFFGLEPYTAIDPDRVVALGAAVQADILRRARAARGSGSPRAGSPPAGALGAGAGPTPLLLDVIPLSLGIETAGGAVAKLVARNSPVPARATEMFSTQVDGQTSIKLNIVQGEREMVADCRSLGLFHLRGLPPMPAGIPQVEVEFLVDANGVLSVTATERRTGARASLQVVPNHGLTRDEVDRIEAESNAHARDDMTRHRIVDLIVNSRLDLKWIGERLERHGGTLEPAYARELASLITALRSLVDRAEADWRSVDADAFYAAKNALDQASVRLQEVSIAATLRASDSDGL